MGDRIASLKKIEEQHPDICINHFLSLLEIPNSTWYYSKVIKEKVDNRINNTGRPLPGHSKDLNGKKISDDSIVRALKFFRSLPQFINGGGYIKLKYYLLREYGYVVNKKKIYRLCKENKLLLLLRKKKYSKFQRVVATNRCITRPNQLWEFDIKYGYIHGERKHFFILIFIDVFTRKVVGFHIGLSCNAGDLVFTLDEALRNAGIADENELVIRSDNGPQMTSKNLKKYLASLEVNLDHEFIPCKTPNKNAHVESFNSIFEIEFLQTRYFFNYESAYGAVVDFIEYYNSFRIHSSLKYRTPNEVTDGYKSGADMRIKEVRV